MGTLSGSLSLPKNTSIAASAGGRAEGTPDRSIDRSIAVEISCHDGSRTFSGIFTLGDHQRIRRTDAIEDRAHEAAVDQCDIRCRILPWVEVRHIDADDVASEHIGTSRDLLESRADACLERVAIRDLTRTSRGLRRDQSDAPSPSMSRLTSKRPRRRRIFALRRDSVAERRHSKVLQSGLAA